MYGLTFKQKVGIYILEYCMKNLSIIQSENYEISVILCKIKQIRQHVLKMQQNYVA
jgi:hypothetical protein